MRSLSRRRVLAGGAALAAAFAAGAARGQAALPLTRIAFGSCADQKEPQPIWEAILRYRPDLFIFAGDNVYGDVTGPELAELREAYRVAAASPGLKRLRESVPHLAIWDDHDYGVNDAGAEFAHKRESQRLFAEFWDLPADDPRRARDGVYHAATFGPPGKRLQVVLLDTRFFRSPLMPTDQRGAAGKERYLPDPDPAKTMLGDAQWRWLEERLREPADLRLIVSSIQVLAEGHGWERWGNLPRERRRLLDLIAATRANGVIFLSGDRHIGALYEQVEGAPYRLVEITSSGLTKSFPGAREAGPNRLGALYGLANFGAIDIDWWADEAALTLADVAGVPKRREVLRISALRAP